MKKHGFLFIVILISSFCIIGCVTNKTTPVRYSFVKDEKEAASLTFYFKDGLYSSEAVYFLDFEGTTLPKPETGTRWEDTIIFPAGVPLKIKVRVARDRDAWELDPLADLGDRSRNVVFECPPLEAGKEYRLTYNYRAIINDQLILTEKNTKKAIYVQTFF